MSIHRTIPVACFAPPLNDALLARYETHIAAVDDDELRDCLRTLYRCVAAWWQLPDSTRPAKRWEFDRGKTLGEEVPLEDEHVEALWEVTPWMRELLAMEPLLDAIPVAQPDLRNMAFHLLWHCKEITLDREPMTTERLMR